jgi:hypothetical protein
MFFEKLAKDLNIAKPEDWYKYRLVDIYQKGGSTVIKKYGSSLIKGNILKTSTLTNGSFEYSLWISPATMAFLCTSSRD